MQEEKVKVEEIEEEGQEIEIEEKVDDSKEEVVVDSKAPAEDKQEEPDELSEYSESVKKRISKLTSKFREEERQRNEAIKFAEAVKSLLLITCWLNSSFRARPFFCVVMSVLLLLHI